MKTIVLLCIAFLSCTLVYGQDLIFPSTLKKGDTFIKFESKQRNTVNVTKVLKNLSNKDLKDFQEKLTDLGYDFEISNELNEKSKQVIFDFNQKECGIDGNCITERTITILNKLHRKHSKAKRKAERKAKHKL